MLRPEDDHYRQVESITVSWCTAEKLEDYIRRADIGAFNEPFGRIDARRIERAHERCPHCM